MQHRTRWLKWLGLPPMVQADGFRVFNWEYENTRPIAMTMPPSHQGRVRRVLEKGTHETHAKEKFTIAHDYMWTQDHNQFVTEVTFTDALAILALCPREFADVTDLPRDKWPSVKHKPIVKSSVPPAPSPSARPRLFVPRRSLAR